MAKNTPQKIRFRGREEIVEEIFSVRGRRYFALERLSRRGAFRVFDRQAGPDGDYRVLYQFPFSRVTRQKIETLRRFGGPTANRNFPGIVDYARQGSDLFVIWSWVWGTNLRDLLQDVRAGKSPRPGVPETVRLIRGLAHGISHYHRQAHLVHGDISPANVIVTSGTKNLVLIDFGSAWPVEQSAGRGSGDGVTRPYAAPERIAHHALGDFRADLFSLTVVAWEMLTLEIPYDGAGGQAGLPLVVESFSQSWVPPSRKIARRNRLPRKSVELLDDVFRMSLSLHPDGRYATPPEWLDAWDELHYALRKGGRLSVFEHWLFGLLETLGGMFSTGRSKP